MTLRHSRQPFTVGIAMHENTFPRSYRRSIVAVVGCLLLFSGCKKEAPTATEPSTPPPGTGLALHGLVIKADVPGARYDPLPGATVKLDSGTAGAQTQVSDSAGAFTFTNVAEGSHTVKVSHATEAVSLDTTLVVSQSSGVFSLYVYPAWVYVDLTGMVELLDSSSGTRTPLAGAKVTLDAGTVNVKTTTTTEAGTFSLAQILEGLHRLQITHPTIFTLDTLATFTGPGPTFACVARRAAVLKGTVRARERSSGQLLPLAGARVSMDTGTVNAQLVETDPFGGFTFTQVHEGMHHLKVSDPSIVTLDTQVVASFSTGALSLTVESLPTVVVFPLAVGARWVYDFTYVYRSEWSAGAGWRRIWERGTISFTVLTVSDADSIWRWTIREEDDLLRSDTSWYFTTGYMTQQETHEGRDFTFSMYERKAGLHAMRNDSCEAIWRVPSTFHGMDDPGDPKLDYTLTRYVTEYGDTVIYQKHSSDGRVLESRRLVRDVGLVQCYIMAGYSIMDPSYAEWSATLLSYTPGQASSSTVMGKRPWP
jgi:hypothetical protein